MLPCVFPFLSDRRYLIMKIDDAVSKKFLRRLLFGSGAATPRPLRAMASEGLCGFCIMSSPLNRKCLA